jgi:hypothetical protein
MQEEMCLSLAQESDLVDVLTLQSKYHIASISEEQKVNGFVTTLFTHAQLLRLVQEENGLFIARQNDVLVAYVMSASWQYWSQWPIFAHMMTELHLLDFKGQKVTVDNSYQYGPVCIDASVRGMGLLENIFDFARAEMAKKYPILITFINKKNTRSYAAHTKKLGLQVIQEFGFNQQEYFELVYDTSVSFYKNST